MTIIYAGWKNKSSHSDTSRSNDMFRHFETISSFPGGRAQWYRLTFFVALLSIIQMVSGCSSMTSEQSYEDFGSSGGLRLEKPRNWHAEFDERTETIVLKAERGILRKDSIRIVIQPFTTLPESSLLSEHLEAAIELTGVRENSDSVTVVQEPTIVEDEAHSMATATILIPTMSIPKDSTEDQVGVQALDRFQTVTMRAIRCPGNFAVIYVYEGNSDQLNAEAEAIVESIQLTCTTEP